MPGFKWNILVSVKHVEIELLMEYSRKNSYSKLEINKSIMTGEAISFQSILISKLNKSGYDW